jgi:hypothetical protein
MGSSSSKERKNTSLSYTSHGSYRTPDVSRSQSPRRRHKRERSFNSKIYKDHFPKHSSPAISNRSTNYDELEGIPEIDICEINEYEIKTVKTCDEIRRSYLARLVFHNIWQPHQERKVHNSLIIFDWDDTLLPTSYLTPDGKFTDDMTIEGEDLTIFKEIEKSAYSLLSRSIERGSTYIVTNAGPGWVEYSAKRFYPNIARILNKVNIISARGAYEKLYPGDTKRWKIEAFMSIVNGMDHKVLTNVVCIGDSMIEIEAAQALAYKFNYSYIKTIKLQEIPLPEKLNKQLILIVEQFDTIMSAVKNLTIRIDKKPNECLDK